MNNQFNIHKDIGDIKTNSDEKGAATPYISISDSSNMQVESSHFSINNKNSTSYINNQPNITNHNNNNNLISTNSDFLSFTKSIINNNINISHNNNNNSGIQISFENVSLSGSNKLQISSNSIIFKKNDTKNSIFLSPSTLCNYYQQSNDVTPYKSPLLKQQEHEHELLREKESSSGKEMPKLKQINIDILHKRKNTFGSSGHHNNIINKNININNIGIGGNSNSNINSNNCEITSRSDECSLDNNKTLSSQRKYLFDKKTPIKYAKNQLKSGEKNKSSKSNNSKLENNENNSNSNINIDNNEEGIKNKKKKGISMIQNKNGRNLMDTFEKVGNYDENLKFFNNRQQQTEIHVTSDEYKINIYNNNNLENNVENNFNKKFMERLDEDSSFMEKDNNIKTNNEIEDLNFFEKIKNGLIKEKNEEKNIYNNLTNNENNNNINVNVNNDKNEKIEKKKEEIKKNKENNKEIKENNNNSNIQINKEDWKKICIKKVLPNKKENNNSNNNNNTNNNITELSKNIIKELSRTNLNKRKESRTKSRPSSFTKNIIINFNSFNSIGINNNNNNIESILGIKNKKNILIKKPRYNNEFKNTNDIFDKKNKKIKNNQEIKQNNNTIEPFYLRRKIKIPNRPGKKDKNSKEISICSITNNKERKRPPSSENYNRRASSFSNLKQTMNTNLFHNNNNTNVNNNKIINKKSLNSNNPGQKNQNKNHQNKKQKPLISNLFVEQDSKQTVKNTSHYHPQQQNNDINNNMNNYKSNQQENITHKIIKKKMKPLISKKEKEKEKEKDNNSNNNMNININDRNYQTVSSVSRNVLDIKIRNKLNDKKENEEIQRKKDIKFNKSFLNNNNTNNNTNSTYNTTNNNNNYNDTKINSNTNMNITNNLQIKKKEDQKVKIIQNFSSYHKIKYKSHISDKNYFAETQTKQFCPHGEDLYSSNFNKNSINNINKDNQKYNNNTYQQGGENNNNGKNKIKHIKFRKLEKLPGDSDSGDVDLNEKFL